MKKLSLTQQWMKDHPDDVPCPRMPDAAAAWRRKRGLQAASWQNTRDALREKYEAAMAEKRAYEAKLKADDNPPPEAA